MTQEDYKRAGVIVQDLKALNNCGIPSFASEELKEEFNDWIKKILKENGVDINA